MGKTVNVQVTEYFPAYQCSINNMDWSPAVMFDAASPFPDVRKNYFPIEIEDGWFQDLESKAQPLFVPGWHRQGSDQILSDGKGVDVCQ